MMNRRKRRSAAKLDDIVEIKLGRVVFDIKPGEDTSRDICYVCGKPATAWPPPQPSAPVSRGIAGPDWHLLIDERDR